MVTLPTGVWPVRYAADATDQFGRRPGPVSLTFCDGLVHGHLHAYQQCRNASSGGSQSASGDWVELIWEQEAPGSNPGIPTRALWILDSQSGSRLC